MEENNVYYVYAYLDPRKPGTYTYGDYTFDHEPFYIGKGKGDRMYKHLRDKLGTQENNIKVCKIQKLLSNGTPPIITKYKDEMTEQEAFMLEAEMISAVGRSVEGEGPLTNILPGGGGSDMPEEVRAKISEIMKNREISEETRAKIKLINKGRKQSQEHLAKLSSVRKGKYAGFNHPMWGKTHNEESKLKQSLVKCKYVYYIMLPVGELVVTHSANRFAKTHPELNSSGLRVALNSGKILYKDMLAFRFPKEWSMDFIRSYTSCVCQLVQSYCQQSLSQAA